MEEIVTTAHQNMQKALEVLKADLSTIRTGRATPALVENIVVSVYGGTAKMKIVELAHCSALDAQTLQIAPYDISIINEIGKGIQEANLGLTPAIDGQIIRITIPALSQERREQLVHLVNQKLEGAKVQIRQSRHEAMDEIKKLSGVSEDDQERLEKEVQKATDDTTKEIDVLGDKKKEELMQV